MKDLCRCDHSHRDLGTNPTVELVWTTAQMTFQAPGSRAPAFVAARIPVASRSKLRGWQQVDLLLGRIAAAYYDVQTFDDLPTPFRAVAVDLLSAEQGVFDRGSLAVAMRATMSLPLIFPPVHMDGRVLVDGGAMNNVPADVVRAMGAGRVVAINVGQLSNQTTVDYSMFGRSGGRHARRDDAGQHQLVDHLGRRHHQRAARGIRIAGPARRHHRSRQRALAALRGDRTTVQPVNLILRVFTAGEGRTMAPFTGNCWAWGLLAVLRHSGRFPDTCPAER
jgi:predicted acylesterase/phospholipase RssA